MGLLEDFLESVRLARAKSKLPRPKEVMASAIKSQARTSKFVSEPEDHARERLRAHWPGHNRDIDIALERVYHRERRN